MSSEERSLAVPRDNAADLGDQRATNKRLQACDQSIEIQVTSDDTFVYWDVAISPVVSAAGGGFTVSVEAGYSLSNSVGVTNGVSAGVEGFLSSSLLIDFSETRTTTQASSLVYDVLEGQFGVVVSQPRIRRVQGNLLTGCPNSPTAEPFSSSQYFSQQFGGLSWVEGTIRLCNSTEYPIPYCIGSNTRS
jgi:hypothetical protein